MNKISSIENDCFYLWLDKPEPDDTSKFNIKELIIGDSVGGIVNSTGIAKFKKFFHKDLKKERSVAYKYKKTFIKEPGSKWFIISQKELKKGNVQGCTEFHEITVLDHSKLITPKGKKPLRKKHFYYIVLF